MKIVKISQSKEFKEAILNYYKEPTYQNHKYNKKILQMMKQFKDDDFVISVLYDDLYKKIQEYNKELEKELEIIKLETNRPKKIKDLIKFYTKAYGNVSHEELDQVHYDTGVMTVKEINNYIDKYVTSWKDI